MSTAAKLSVYVAAASALLFYLAQDRGLDWLAMVGGVAFLVASIVIVAWMIAQVSVRRALRKRGPMSLSRLARRMDQTYLRLFNITARLLALAMTFVGGGSFIQGAIWMLSPSSTLSVNGVQTTDVAPKLAFVVLGLVVMALGILLLRASPYRPDLGDRTIAFPRRKEPPGQRSWWTGEPRANLERSSDSESR